MEPGSTPDGFRIPFCVFHRLRDHENVDLAEARFTFAKRGLSFYMEVVKQVGRIVHAANKPH